MRKLAGVSLALALFVPILRAQSDNISLITATDPYGSVTVTVANHAAVALTAILVEEKFPTGRSPRYEDAALPGSKPILPMQQSVERAPVGTTAVIEAAIWADGSTYGAPMWVQRIRDHRAAYIRSLNQVISVFQRARNLGTPPGEIVMQLQTLADAAKARSVNREDVGAAIESYNEGLEHITNPSRLLDGSIPPLPQALEGEIRSLVAHRDQFLKYD
jgi:hypothetical protein